MSELKAFELKAGKNLETDSPLVVGVDNKWNSRVMSGDEVYIKSEADKVIAEKDAEIAELKEQVHDYAQGMYVIQAKAEKEARHQKHKRCMAMAKWCGLDMEQWVEGSLRWQRRKNWCKRWLELAEKFKEGK